jgi:peptide deformylase
MENEVLPIIIYGDSILREKCKDVPKDYDIKKLVGDMKLTLSKIKTGAGLAAPQVGVPLRVFLGPNGQEFINFEITQMKGSNPRQMESCLSIPGVSGNVRRFQKVRIKWYDQDWNLHEKLFKEFDARLIQHEADHTDGILYIDRMDDKKERASLEMKLLDLEDGVLPNHVEYETNIV